MEAVEGVLNCNKLCSIMRILLIARKDKKSGILSGSPSNGLRTDQKREEERFVWAVKRFRNCTRTRIEVDLIVSRQMSFDPLRLDQSAPQLFS
jgi:hypothetical protein